MKLPEIGDVFTVPYPFVRETFTNPNHGEGWDGAGVPTWVPGTRNDVVYVHGYEEESECRADGLGAQILTVRGVYTVPGYRTRVFYHAPVARP